MLTRINWLANESKIEQHQLAMIIFHIFHMEVLMVQWLGALAHSRKVAGSIPAHAIGLFRWNLQQIP